MPKQTVNETSTKPQDEASIPTYYIAPAEEKNTGVSCFYKAVLAHWEGGRGTAKVTQCEPK